MPDNAIYNYKDKRDAINAIYAMLTEGVDETDITEVVFKSSDGC